jgi:hypothetical protein
MHRNRSPTTFSRNSRAGMDLASLRKASSLLQRPDSSDASKVDKSQGGSVVSTVHCFRRWMCWIYHESRLSTIPSLASVSCALPAPVSADYVVCKPVLVLSCKLDFIPQPQRRIRIDAYSLQRNQPSVPSRPSS